MKPAMIIVLCIVLFLPLLARSQMESLGRNDTFRAAQLTKREVEELVRQVQDSAFDTADDWQSELRVRRVDLGSSPGHIIQGTKLLCGGTGNCQTWVFRKLDDRWISLFPGNKVPTIEGFHIGPAATIQMESTILRLLRTPVPIPKSESHTILTESIIVLRPKFNECL